MVSIYILFNIVNNTLIYYLLIDIFLYLLIFRLPSWQCIIIISKYVLLDIFLYLLRIQSLQYIITITLLIKTHII